MKAHIRRRVFKTLEELCTVIKEYWKTLKPEVCTRYVGGIHWRVAKVVVANGGNIFGKKNIKRNSES
ncbi:hypothetical protein Q1695_001386 [Nippostrongylus brasiliensis]|nr:hypothetical protein Q1695_001386 [Nippostrongylus brasiliensis]